MLDKINLDGVVIKISNFFHPKLEKENKDRNPLLHYYNQLSY